MTGSRHRVLAGPGGDWLLRSVKGEAVGVLSGGGARCDVVSYQVEGAGADKTQSL